MSKPRMCPHCRAFIEPSEKTCQYCGNELPSPAAKRIAREGAGQGMLSQAVFTTSIIMLINAGLFAATWILTSRFNGQASFLGGVDYNVLKMLGAKEYGSILYGGDWWRLVTANFLHGGLLHLAFNSMALFQLGPLCEQIFGTPRYIVIYVVAGVSGYLASLFYTPALSIGASASICGLLGALYGYGRMSKNSMIESNTTRWIIFLAIYGFLVDHIDNAAHAGGLIGGFALAYLGGTPGLSDDKESIWKGAAIVVGLISAAAFFLAYQNFSQATQ